MVARTPDTSGKTGSAELARVIRERRERLGLSRQELADAAGIPYPTLAQIETAYRGVSPARLGLLARVLGLDPKDLYEVLAAPEEEAGVEEEAGIESAAGVESVAGIRAEPTPSPTAGSWHPNLRFAAAAAPPAAAPAPVRARGVRREQRPAVAEDVVEQAVALLARVPADDRIAVLAQIQTRVLEDLVTLRTPPPDSREK